MLDQEEDASVEPLNPLIIPHIADLVSNHVFNNCPVELLSMRQVCSTWAISASQVLRNSSHVWLRRKDLHRTEKLWSVLSVTSNIEFLPLANFTFSDGFLCDANCDLIKQLLLVHSEIVQSLEFRWDRDSTAIFDEQSFFIVEAEFRCLQFPKLKRLSTKDVRDGRKCASIPFKNWGTRLVVWLVKASPNLSHLSISYTHSAKEMFKEQLQDKDFVQCFCNLKALELDINLDNELNLQLSKVMRNSKLKVLKLWIRGSEFSSHSMYCFLREAHTLEELQLLDLDSNSQVMFNFPALKTLKTLKIQGRNLTRQYFERISYRRTFPMLECLLLQTWGHKASGKDCDCVPFVLSFERVDTVKELVLGESVSNFKCVSAASKMFHNLSKLELCLSLYDIRLLALVLEEFVTLTHLKITKSWLQWDRRAFEESLNLDFILTGIPKEVCRLLLNHEKFPPSLVPNFEQVLCNNLIDPYAKTGLLRLQNLRRLELDVQYVGEVTDVTGYLVLMRMNHLHYMNVSRSLMSQRCIVELAGKFPDNMKSQLSANSYSPRSQNNGYGNDDITWENWVIAPSGCGYL